MSNRLTWQQVAAPDFTGAAQILNQAVQNWSGGFTGINDNIKDIRQRQKTNRSAAAIPLLAQAASEADFNAALGQITNTIRPEDMTLDLQNQILAGRGNALGYDQTRQSMSLASAASGRAAAAASREAAREAKKDAAQAELLAALGLGPSTAPASGGAAPAVSMASGSGGGSSTGSPSGSAAPMSAPNNSPVGSRTSNPMITAGAGEDRLEGGAGGTGSAPAQTATQTATQTPAQPAQSAFQVMTPERVFQLSILSGEDLGSALNKAQSFEINQFNIEQEKAALVESASAKAKEEAQIKTNRDADTRLRGMITNNAFPSRDALRSAIMTNQAYTEEERNTLLDSEERMFEQQPDFFAAAGTEGATGSSSTPIIDARQSFEQAMNLAGVRIPGMDTGTGAGGEGEGKAKSSGGNASAVDVYGELPEDFKNEVSLNDFTSTIRDVARATGVRAEVFAKDAANFYEAGLFGDGINADELTDFVMSQYDPDQSADNNDLVQEFNQIDRDLKSVDSEYQKLQSENAAYARQNTAASNRKIEANNARMAELETKATELSVRASRIGYREPAPTEGQPANQESANAEQIINQAFAVMQDPDSSPAEYEAALAALQAAARGGSSGSTAESPAPENAVAGSGAGMGVNLSARYGNADQMGPAVPNVSGRAVADRVSNLLASQEGVDLPGLTMLTEGLGNLRSSMRSDVAVPVQSAGAAANAAAQGVQTQREAAQLVTTALSNPQVIAQDPMGFVTSFAVLRETLGPRHPIVLQATPLVQEIMAMQRNR